MTARIETTLLPTDAIGERIHAQTYMERFRAPFSLRCGALLIDYILVVGIIAFSTLLARLGGHGPATTGNAQIIGIIIAIIVAAINFIGLSALRGQTLGKWATGLCVRRTDGEPLSWERALLRHLVLYPPAFLILGLGFLVAGMLPAAAVACGASILTLGIGFLMATVSPHGRALHDVIADTVVAREDVRRKQRISY
ncbi:MAG: hypothetical protein QOH63_2059 [Acidobacteriota bacterium]|jgi:uncharacterized RDD family membrane protein YckC|nr:hypothetical protein [Acidobacteriota bacterium]